MFVDLVPFIAMAGIIWVTIWYFKSEAREHSDDKDEVGKDGDDGFIWLPPPPDDNDNNDMGDW